MGAVAHRLGSKHRRCGACSGNGWVKNYQCLAFRRDGGHSYRCQHLQGHAGKHVDYTGRKFTSPV